MKLVICSTGDTLRNKGSKRVPPEGLWFQQELSAPEELFLEERVCQGFFVGEFLKNVGPPSWVVNKIHEI